MTGMWVFPQLVKENADKLVFLSAAAGLMLWESAPALARYMLSQAPMLPGVLPQPPGCPVTQSS